MAKVHAHVKSLLRRHGYPVGRVIKVTEPGVGDGWSTEVLYLTPKGKHRIAWIRCEASIKKMDAEDVKERYRTLVQTMDGWPL